ncbi:MAG: GNAT family N-acetyltransferase [Kiloniellales bacterium]|nr:GNAT family N-acetyltransferase [Kiloniellales bacterium]
MSRAPEPAGPRDATSADLAGVREIYAYHVLHGLASFEEEPPNLEEIGRRFAETRRLGLPFLVVETLEGIAGFAYARPYRPRPAYRFSVEDSVYLRPGFERRGFGRLLLAALIEACTAAGYRQMIAVIGDSANLPSIGLHKALGFREVGTIASVGFKLGRWVDSVVLQLPLGEGDGTLPTR